MKQTPEKVIPRKNYKDVLKKIGVAGFIFFLVKGIIWLMLLWGAGSLFK